MIINPWKKLLTNNYRFKPDHLEYRRVFLLNLVLVSLFCICLFFTICNLILTKHVTVILINTTASILSLATLYYFHKTDNINTATFIAVLLLFSTLLIYLSVVEHRSYALYWICIFPPVVYFLLGRRKASIFTGVYSTYLFTFILMKYKLWGPTEFTIDSILNIAGATFGLIIIISYFELSRKEVAQALEEKNLELVTINSILKENKDQLRLILDSTAEAIFGIDKEGLCTFCNASCVELLGYKHQGEMLGKNMHCYIHHSHRNGLKRLETECEIFKTFLIGKKAHVDNEVFWRADGTCFDVEYYSYPQYNNGEIIGAVVSFKDITVQKRTQEKIKFLSCHDPLTGLFNRSCFEDELKKIDSIENLPISIIFGDVNWLKLTNDVFGHVAGDALIKKTAEILKKVCREEDIVSRVGGDEFVIILPHTKASDAENIISRVTEELSKEEIVAIKCSMSMGYDTKTSVNQSLDIIMENAENLMYKEKTLDRKALNSDMINTIISTLHERSSRERQHSITVSELCQDIGRAMKLSKTEVKKLKEAGFIHDIGKIILDDSTLNKDGNLTAEEKKEMQRHSVIGYRILNLFDDTLDLAEGVYSHHEKWDGTGYPKGLKGEEIPIIARIITLVEIYERTVYDYKKITDSAEEKAIQFVRHHAGLRFDPKITDIFIQMIESQRKYRESLKQTT